MRSLLLSAFVLTALPLISIGAAPPPPSSNPEPGSETFPWHIVEVAWRIPDQSSNEFKSFSMDLDISKDFPDDVTFYLAPMGMGFFGLTPFYGGIITSRNVDNGCPPFQHRFGIFSRWNELCIEATRRQLPDGCAVSLTNKLSREGNFVSVRRPIRWHQGSYRIILNLTGVDSIGRIWVSFEILDKDTNQNTRIGELRFPTGRNNFFHYPISFIEIFSERLKPEQVPNLTVTLSNLRLNDVAANPTSATACYPNTVPNYAQASSPSPGTVSIQIGSGFMRSALPQDSHGTWYRAFEWHGAASQCPIFAKQNL